MKVTYGAIVQSASGRFGGTVHSVWKGVDVVRRFRRPANPNTADQIEVRNLMKFLTWSWIQTGSQMRAAWNAYAIGKPLTGRNHWLGVNIPLLQGEATTAPLIGTPGDASALPLTAIVVTPGAGQLQVEVDAPTTPTGWTVNTMMAAAQKSYDPDAPTDHAELAWHEIADGTPPYDVAITGLDAVLYNVWAWMVWADPTGTLRYSSSIKATGTPT